MTRRTAHLVAAVIYLLVLIGLVLVVKHYADNIHHTHVRHAQTWNATAVVPRETYPPRASRGRIVTTATAMPRPRHPQKVARLLSFSATERHIRACESGDLVSTYDYTMHGGPSTASGAWQVLDGTWGGFMGYPRAYLAPRWVQDRWARNYFDAHGYGAWAASRFCWG